MYKRLLSLSVSICLGEIALKVKARLFIFNVAILLKGYIDLDSFTSFSYYDEEIIKQLALFVLRDKLCCF